MATRRSYSTAAAPTTLTVGIDNAVTSITVQDGSTYVDGTSGPSVLTIDRGKSNEERILYTSRVGNTFSGLTRGYNGTAAQSHTAGAIVEHTSTQQDFDEANAHVSSTQHPFLNVANIFTATQKFTATDNYLGPNANGGPGAVLHVNADTAQTVLLDVGSSGANANLIIQTKGTGNVSFNVSGTQVAGVSAAGVLQATGGDHYFGPNAFGAAGAMIHLEASTGGGNDAFVMAEGSLADANLNLRTKGAGLFRFQNNVGTTLAALFASGQLSIGGIGSGGGSTGAMLGLSNISNLPATPVGGGFVYVQSGALKYVGSSGTVTTLAAA